MYFFFYKNVDIVKKCQISKENSIKAVWLEKLTKTNISNRYPIYNPSCPLSLFSSSSKKKLRSGETDAFKRWLLLERRNIFFLILFHNPKMLS